MWDSRPIQKSSFRFRDFPLNHDCTLFNSVNIQINYSLPPTSPKSDAWSVGGSKDIGVRGLADLEDLACLQWENAFEDPEHLTPTRLRKAQELTFTATHWGDRETQRPTDRNLRFCAIRESSRAGGCSVVPSKLFDASDSGTSAGVYRPWQSLEAQNGTGVNARLV